MHLKVDEKVLPKIHRNEELEVKFNEKDKKIEVVLKKDKIGEVNKRNLRIQEEKVYEAKRQVEFSKFKVINLFLYALSMGLSLKGLTLGSSNFTWDFLIIIGIWFIISRYYTIKELRQYFLERKKK